MKLQLNVTEIENGFLLQLPPTPVQSPIPIICYCETLKQISDHILEIEKTRKAAHPKGDNVVSIN